MIYISHRGNLYGPSELENFPSQVDVCLNFKFDCEIDLWVHDGRYFLGHDSGEHHIEKDWLDQRKKKLWIHCKNSEAVEILKAANDKSVNYFWHENDSYTLTSTGRIWVFPGKRILKGSIAVLPEIWDTLETSLEISLAGGICTDYPFKYIDKYN